MYLLKEIHVNRLQFKPVMFKSRLWVCVCVILPQTNSFSEILVEDQYITAMGRRVLIWNFIFFLSHFWILPSMVALKRSPESPKSSCCQIEVWMDSSWGILKMKNLASHHQWFPLKTKWKRVQVSQVMLMQTLSGLHTVWTSNIKKNCLLCSQLDWKGKDLR